MSITSLTFFSLVLLSIIIYYIIPKSTQWIFLTLLSAGFVYLSSGISMLFVLCAEVIVAWAGAIAIQRISNPIIKRFLLVSLIITILGILFYFRDMEFINIIKRAYSELTSHPVSIISYKVWGPIGISYFTLSLLGYVLDIYWEKYEIEKNPIRLFLFTGYYPQLTSGPIVRYNTMSPQFRCPHQFNPEKVLRGGERILWGCIMKMVIADRVGTIISPMYDNPQNYAGVIWVGVILIYALQIYTDFAGCCTFVLGVSECYGITLPENFNSPFLSQSMAEFWRRWHITMGTWFKDYVMYPLLKSSGMQKFTKKCKSLFGKQFGKRVVVCLGTWVVWITIGLWHGGSWKFIIASGLLPGIYTVFGELMEIPMAALTEKLHINRESFAFRMFGRLRILIIMSINWVFVRAATPKQAMFIWNQLFKSNYMVDSIIKFSTPREKLETFADIFILLLGVILLIYIANQREKGIDLLDKFNSKNTLFKYSILMFGIFLVLIFGIYGPGYNAAAFIYKQF